MYKTDFERINAMMLQKGVFTDTDCGTSKQYYTGYEYARQDEDIITKIHGGASAIGFMMLLVVPLLMAILQCQSSQMLLGTVSIVCFVFAFMFFCFFIMGEKEKFANTVLRYGGLWQRLVLAVCYVTLFIWCVA